MQSGSQSVWKCLSTVKKSSLSAWIKRGSALRYGSCSQEAYLPHAYPLAKPNSSFKGLSPAHVSRSIRRSKGRVASNLLRWEEQNSILQDALEKTLTLEQRSIGERSCANIQLISYISLAPWIYVQGYLRSERLRDTSKKNYASANHLP